MALIRAASLRGLPVINAEAAEQMGRVAEVILDCGAGHVAGLVIRSRAGLLETGQERLIPGSTVVGLGPDALLVDGEDPGEQLEDRLRILPRLSRLAGRNFVTRTGRRLGTLRDALLDCATGRILGYPLDSFMSIGWLDRIPNGHPPLTLGTCDYVRADSDLHFGRTLIVVPAEAVVRNANLTGEALINAMPDGASVRWVQSPDSGLQGVDPAKSQGEPTTAALG